MSVFFIYEECNHKPLPRKGRGIEARKSVTHTRALLVTSSKLWHTLRPRCVVSTNLA